MKQLIKIFIIIFWFSLVTSISGQTTELDTVFVKKTVGENEFEIDTLFIKGGQSSPQVLAGTTFLPNSDKIIGLYNDGLYPISLKIIEECNNDEISSNDYPKFIEACRKSNILTIEVSIVANCCHNFLGEAEVIDNTLNLIYVSYGGFCSCSCTFTLQYKFDSALEHEYQILKYVTINGSKISSKIQSD